MIRYKPGVLSVLTCLITVVGAAFASNHEDMVWRSDNDYVAIVPLEDGAEPNDHPVILEAREVYHILKSIRIRKENIRILGMTIFKPDPAEQTETPENTEALFSEIELQRLSKPIASALATAARNEDIVFSTTGSHENYLLKTGLSTAGRLFHRDNSLHMILGDVRVDYAKKYRRRGGYSDRTPAADDFKLRHFRLETGLRSSETKNSYAFIPGKFQHSHMYESTPRNDWIVVNTEGMRAKIRSQDIEQEKRENIVQERESIKTGIEQIDRRQQELDRKVELLERQLRDSNEPSGQESSDAVDKAGSGIEQRLEELKRLRDKELIPEELYQEKLRAIMNEM